MVLLLTGVSIDQDFHDAAKQSTVEYVEEVYTSEASLDAYPTFSVEIIEVDSRSSTPSTLNLVDDVQYIEPGLLTLHRSDKRNMLSFHSANVADVTPQRTHSGHTVSSDSGFGSGDTRSTTQATSLLTELDWDEMGAKSTLTARDLDFITEDETRDTPQPMSVCKLLIQREPLEFMAYGPVSVHFPNTSVDVGETKAYETMSEAIVAVRRANYGQFDNYCKFDPTIRVLFVFLSDVFATNLLADAKIGIVTLHLPPNSAASYRIISRGFPVIQVQAKTLIDTLSGKKIANTEKHDSKMSCAQPIKNCRVSHSNLRFTSTSRILSGCSSAETVADDEMSDEIDSDNDSVVDSVLEDAGNTAAESLCTQNSEIEQGSGLQETEADGAANLRTNTPSFMRRYGCLPALIVTNHGCYDENAKERMPRNDQNDDLQQPIDFIRNQSNDSLIDVDNLATTLFRSKNRARALRQKTNLPATQPREPELSRPPSPQRDVSAASSISLASDFRFTKFFDEMALIASNGANINAKSCDTFPELILDALNDPEQSIHQSDYEYSIGGIESAGEISSINNDESIAHRSTPRTPESGMKSGVLIEVLRNHGLLPQVSPSLRGSTVGVSPFIRAGNLSPVQKQSPVTQEGGKPDGLAPKLPRRRSLRQQKVFVSRIGSRKLRRR